MRALEVQPTAREVVHHVLIFSSDGDLRRHMERGTDILAMTAGDVMTRDPVAVAPTTLAAWPVCFYRAAS